MSIFKCDSCGCVENTALCNYWMSHRKKGNKDLCSECDPSINKWHGIFPKEKSCGYMLGNDGFLYTKEHVESGELQWRIENQGFRIVGPA